MRGWEWLNLIWMIPLGVLCFCIIFMFTVVWIDRIVRHRYVRKIHAQLYGDIINVCILCPVCETFVYGRREAWEKHLERRHNEPMYYHKLLNKEFEEARLRLSQQDTRSTETPTK